MSTVNETMIDERAISAREGTPGRAFVGISLVSAAALALELTLTRVFSVSIWYHFAFMVVSIALLGFGVSGSYLATNYRRLALHPEKSLFVAGLLFALASLLTMIIAALVPFDPSQLGAYLLPQALYLLAYYVGLALPFFFAGTIVGLLLSLYTRNAGQLYGADLLGAGIGCLMFIAVLPLLGAQGMIALAAGMGVIAAAILGATSGRRRLAAPIAVLCLLGAPFTQQVIDVHIPPSKGLALAQIEAPGLKTIMTRWNAFSRIDVTEGDASRFFAGLSESFQGTFPRQVAIRIDADARTDITEQTGDRTELSYLDHMASSLPYQLVSNPKVLVIGAGGGTDVLAGLYFGSPKVTAVELNPLIVDVVRGPFGSFSGNLYDQPNVDLVVDEGRNFTARSQERFDVIQLSLVDTWAATSSGAYSLSENYLYTVEAFETYFDHLSDRGVLTISRWSREPPVEQLRLVSTAIAALDHHNITEPTRHIAVVKVGDLATTVITRQPLNSADISAVRRFASANDFDLLYPQPDRPNEVQAFIDSPNRNRLIETYPFDISPTTDDMPFFFQYGRWSDLHPASLLDRLNDHLFTGQLILLAALIQAIVLGVVLVLAPLASRQHLRRALGRSPWLGAVTYFTALGLAFMFVEISLMQRLALFLGHPIYSISVVLFTLLVSGGIGSLLSSSVRLEQTRTALATILIILAGVIAYELVLLPGMTAQWLGEPINTRLLATVAAIAPLGVLMGMPFPLGLRLFEQVDPSIVPWAWGINGCASVVGPVLAVVIALSSGFTLVTGLGAAIYLAALIAVLAIGRLRATSDQAIAIQALSPEVSPPSGTSP